MEIYNECVNDLLNPAGKNLTIYEHPKKGVFVNGLAEEVPPPQHTDTDTHTHTTLHAPRVWMDGR